MDSFTRFVGREGLELGFGSCECNDGEWRLSRDERAWRGWREEVAAKHRLSSSLGRRNDAIWGESAYRGDGQEAFANRARGVSILSAKNSYHLR